MKLFLSLTIICASVFIGYSLKKRFSERRQFFADMLHIVELLRVDIAFFQTTLKLSLTKYMEEVGSLAKKVLESYLNYLADESLEKDIDSYLNLDFLSKTEADTIKNLFLFIGSTDSVSQCQMLDNYRQLIGKYLEVSTNKLNKYGNFALKMSLSVGLVIVILTI